MKILIIGATGNTGIELLRMGMAEGHSVTAYARNEEKLIAQLKSSNLPLPKIIVGDVFDKAQLEQACQGQDAVINVAGNVDEGEHFVRLIDAVTEAVEAGLKAEGRFWFLGGAAALDVPGTTDMTVNLPKIPEIFRSHEQNYNRVKASSLNWSMLCPGPMIKSTNGEAHKGLRVSTETWPVPRPTVTRFLPALATSVSFKLAMPELTICYEDAARVILDNLEQSSPLVEKRVGIALPAGVRQTKDISGLTN